MKARKAQLGEDSPVTLRRLDDAERAAVTRLAQLEGRREPKAPWLGAAVAGRVLAVTSLSDGETVADPFSRTAELRAMLELRAAQLRRPLMRQRRRRRRLGGLARQPLSWPAA